MMFRFPSVICTRCTGFFCLAIIKGPPNDIYCTIEEPSKHYFTEKVSYSQFLNSICTPFGLFDIPQSLYLWAFPRFFKLLEFANKFLLLYIFVYVLWFYLVSYVFHCPKSTDCTERCYQFVIN